MTKDQEDKLKVAINKLLLRLIDKVDVGWIQKEGYKKGIAKEFTEGIMYEIVVLEILKEREEKGIKI